MWTSFVIGLELSLDPRVASMNPNHAFCTIIATNYVASARTLCSSLRGFHPDVPRYVLFIDDYRSAFVASDESFQAISLDEIGLDGLDLLRFSYDVVELATAVKPHFLKYLFWPFEADLFGSRHTRSECVRSSF
jgi:hypothetical protein